MTFAFSTTSCQLPWSSVGAQCSGNGRCAPDANLTRFVCHCDDGWSGNSDFRVTSSSTSCQISYVIIRVMWALLLALGVFTYIRVFPQVRFLVNKHFVVVAKYKATGKSYGLRDNKALSNLLIMSVFGMPSLIAMCILKLVQPEMHVGAQWGPTILWWIMRFCSYASAFSFQPALLSSLLANQAGFEGVIRLNNALGSVFLFFSVASGALALWPLIADPYDPFNPVPGIGAFLYLGIMLSLSTFGGAMQTIYIERKIVHTLNKSHEVAKNPKTLEIKEKLASLQRSVRTSLLLQTFIYTFLVVFPYMWMLHDYFLPISWIAPPFVYRRMPGSIIENEGSRGKKKSSTTDAADKNLAAYVDRRASGPETNESGTGTLPGGTVGAMKSTQVESGGEV